MNNTDYGQKTIPLVDTFLARGAALQKPEDPGFFEIMGAEGDTKAIWDKNNPEEVEAAKRQFDYLVKEKGYAAFSVVGEKGDKGEQIRTFDPKAERIIFCPPLKGG